MTVSELKRKSLPMAKEIPVKLSFAGESEDKFLRLEGKKMKYNFAYGVLCFTEDERTLYVTKRTDEAVASLEVAGFESDKSFWVPFAPYNIEFEYPGYTPGMFD